MEKWKNIKDGETSKTSKYNKEVDKAGIKQLTESFVLERGTYFMDSVTCGKGGQAE